MRDEVDTARKVGTYFIDLLVEPSFDTIDAFVCPLQTFANRVELLVEVLGDNVHVAASLFVPRSDLVS